MNPKINLRKITFRTYFKTISHYFGFKRPIVVQNRSKYSCTEFVGEFSNKQRPKLAEINDEKYRTVDLISERIYGI